MSRRPGTVVGSKSISAKKRRRWGWRKYRYRAYLLAENRIDSVADRSYTADDGAMIVESHKTQKNITWAKSVVVIYVNKGLAALVVKDIVLVQCVDAT